MAVSEIGRASAEAARDEEQPGSSSGPNERIRLIAPRALEQQPNQAQRRLCTRRIYFIAASLTLFGAGAAMASNLMSHAQDININHPNEFWFDPLWELMLSQFVITVGIIFLAEAYRAQRA